MRANTFRSTAKTHRHRTGALSATVVSHPSNPRYGVFREGEEDFFGFTVLFYEEDYEN